MTVPTRQPLPYQGPPSGFWYGSDPAWRYPLEAAARRRLGDRLRVRQTGSGLVYDALHLPVTGRDPVDVTITFHRHKGTRHFGLPARDMPEVRADPGGSSPRAWCIG